MEENIKKWLREGAQSKATKKIKDLSKKFSGNDFQKITSMLMWISKNIKGCKNYEKALKIFATRTIAKIFKDGFSVGCHDNALIFAVLCRASGIPARCVMGIDKLSPKNKGHCVVEVYIDKKWVLVDQSKKQISLESRNSVFYKENFVVGKGLDFWDIGIKSFKDWKTKSNIVIKAISKMEV